MAFFLYMCRQYKQHYFFFSYVSAGRMMTFMSSDSVQGNGERLHGDSILVHFTENVALQIPQTFILYLGDTICKLSALQWTSKSKNNLCYMFC